MFLGSIVTSFIQSVLVGETTNNMGFLISLSLAKKRGPEREVARRWEGRKDEHRRRKSWKFEIIGAKKSTEKKDVFKFRFVNLHVLYFG